MSTSVINYLISYFCGVYSGGGKYEIGVITVPDRWDSHTWLKPQLRILIAATSPEAPKIGRRLSSWVWSTDSDSYRMIVVLNR